MISQCFYSEIPKLLFKKHPAVRTSVSVGLVFAPFSDRFKDIVVSESQLFKQADLLLYQAKNNGKNQVCVKALNS